MSRHVWKPINWDDAAGAVGVAERPAPPGLARPDGAHFRTPAVAPALTESALGAPGQPSAPIVPAGLPEQPPRQKLSFVRVLLLLVLVAGAASAVLYGVRSTLAARAAARVGPTWFAPYVDVTLTPTYQFQDPTAEPARQVVLGFVVASSARSCQPSWGGYYDLAQASQTLSLDGRLAQLHEEGIGAVVSFGGKNGTDLAQSCSSAASLAGAYGAVVSRYHLTTVDFDVEGSALTNWASVKRRAAALHLLQSQLAARHKSLAVWLTLPVEQSGLQAGAMSVLTEMLAAHVRLAGVDVMAMDYGGPVASMAGAAEQALSSTHAQLAELFPRYDIRLSSVAIWHSLGVTVMIGQNDVAGEVFTPADASALERFARGQHLGRVSMWSLNRDQQCGTDYGVNGVLSNTCSGTSQAGLAFASTFAHLSGTAAVLAGKVAPLVASGAQVNPADAPYPIWSPADPYVTGYKVVRLGNVYQAKWYNQGQDPAANVQYPWQTPWTLIGPVLPGEHAPVTTTLPAGTYRSWSPTRSYRAGARVLFGGLPYQAKWFNQASSPAAEAANPTGSPWQPLFSVPGEPTGSSGG